MRRKLTMILALVLAFALILGACGGAEKTEEQKPADSAETSEGGKRDTLVVATAYDAITLDPVANNDSPSSHAMHQLYNTLIELD